MEASQQVTESRPEPKSLFDTQRLKAEMKLAREQILETKVEIHKPHTPETGTFQSRLVRQRRRATVLCSIAAHLHGRVHLGKKETAAQQRERIATQLSGFAI